MSADLVAFGFVGAFGSGCSSRWPPAPPAAPLPSFGLRRFGLGLLAAPLAFGALFASAVRRRGFRRGVGAASRAAVVDREDRLADLDLVALLDLDLFHLAGDRRRHLNRRLVGFELEDRLILCDRVAGLDQDAEDVAGLEMFSPSSGSVKSVGKQNLESLAGC